MSKENANLASLNSEEFSELLRTTYLKGAIEAHEKQKVEDVRIKEIVLTAILEAAIKGKTSTRVMLDSYLSKNNENFLRAAHIDWEVSSNRGGLLMASVEYAFYWENLENDLIFEEEN